jgi:GxxExxY protein
MKMVEELIYKEESYAIVVGCFSVYKDKGCGFLEPVYQECMEIELDYLKLPAVPKPSLALSYRGRPLKQKYMPDFICYDKIVLELKAVSQLTDEHRAQVLNYLNATGLKLGLLVNFGHYPQIEWERIVNTPKPAPAFGGRTA